MINTMKSYASFKKQLLKDPEIQKAYDDLEPEFALIESIIKKRIEKGMTQSAISRLESGDSNPSFVFLKKVAKALGSKLKVSFS